MFYGAWHVINRLMIPLISSIGSASNTTDTGCCPLSCRGWLGFYYCYCCHCCCITSAAASSTYKSLNSAAGCNLQSLCESVQFTPYCLLLRRCFFRNCSSPSRPQIFASAFSLHDANVDPGSQVLRLLKCEQN